MRENEESAFESLQEQYCLMERKLKQYQLITSVNIEQIESKRQSICACILYSSLKSGEHELPLVEQKDWQLLFLWTDIAQFQFYSRLKEQYPYLQQCELKLCCLVRLRFSFNEILDILEIQHDTLYTRKSVLKKHLRFKGPLEEFISLF